MNAPHQIRRYPNRRLYDPAQARYITAADIRRLVEAKSNFIIVDKPTGADITCAVLLQLILPEEQGSARALTSEFLMLAIRIQAHGPRAEAASYLEHSLDVFTRETAAPAR